MTRKFIQLIILVFLIGINIYGQKTNVINFEKVYSFLNSTMINDKTEFNLSDQTDIEIFGDITKLIFKDSLFDNEDREFIRNQISMLGKVKWQDGKIMGANIISQKDINLVFKSRNGWDKFRKKYGGCLTNFSLPIFNKNDNYCIFYNWTQCDYLSGGGSLDLYKFENGKWIFIKSYVKGVS
ncbi:hypothetical protein [Flagellimonas beolgyonensis]|uniref:hypothetical protein n=1 Tax=Flagellimonas beolgyonensis TaxID=864064 RepID=UPI003D64F9CE